MTSNFRKIDPLRTWTWSPAEEGFLGSDNDNRGNENNEEVIEESFSSPNIESDVDEGFASRVDDATSQVDDVEMDFINHHDNFDLAFASASAFSSESDSDNVHSNDNVYLVGTQFVDFNTLILPRLETKSLQCFENQSFEKHSR